MAIEDQLSPDERRRLEALAQATALHAYGPSPDPDTILGYARRYDEWIKEG